VVVYVVWYRDLCNVEYKPEPEDGERPITQLGPGSRSKSYEVLLSSRLNSCKRR
jgi:hypothetical protein